MFTAFKQAVFYSLKIIKQIIKFWVCRTWWLKKTKRKYINLSPQKSQNLRTTRALDPHGPTVHSLPRGPRRAQRWSLFDGTDTTLQSVGVIIIFGPSTFWLIDWLLFTYPFSLFFTPSGRPGSPGSHTAGRGLSRLTSPAPFTFFLGLGRVAVSPLPVPLLYIPSPFPHFFFHINIFPFFPSLHNLSMWEFFNISSKMKARHKFPQRGMKNPNQSSF